MGCQQRLSPGQGLFIVTLSDGEGSKVLDCIPFFNIRTRFLLKDTDSSPTAQNDIFPENEKTLSPGGLGYRVLIS